ncbi:MAG TPA: hypothetical protein PKD72_07500 [Gemmatales bacterium]|nr:hypothetical protein [Gemmatales bacterium]
MITTRKRLFYTTISLVALLLLLAYWRLTAPPEHQVVMTMPGTVADSDSKQNTLRMQLLGTWQDDYEGKRTMTLRDDGTGTMMVELTGMKAALFASKLRFEMQWSLDNKKLIKTTIGGEPASKVNMILNMMGNTAEDTIIEITNDRLLLLDKDGKTHYDWRRVQP